MKAKFQIGDILTLALIIVVAGIGIAFGLQMLGDIQGDMTASSAEYNATGLAIDGVSVFAEKLPLISLVVVAAVLIGILVRYMMVGGGN